jgi:hypothetical protein
LETPAQLARNGSGRVNEADTGPGNISNDVADEWIVRASQHDRVGAPIEHRSKILLDERTRRCGREGAALDLLDQARTRLRQHFHVAGVRAHELRELLPGQRLRRRQDAHDFRTRLRGSGLDCGLDRDDRLDVASAQRIDGDPGRRVAGDNNGLHMLSTQELHDRDRATADVVLRTITVRRVARVSHVNQIFGGKFASNLAQDGEAADAGVEHADRSVAPGIRDPGFGIRLLLLGVTSAHSATQLPSNLAT